MHKHFTRAAFAAASSLALVAAPISSSAQPGNPGFDEPGEKQLSPGVPGSAATNHPDRMFVYMTAIGGMSEVELGRMAQKQGANQAIQTFGKQMTGDHGKSNEQLIALARKLGLPLPDAPDAKHRAERERLAKLKGDEFDLAYLAQQLGAHQMSANLLIYEIGSGHNQALKDFALENLPTVLAHLDMLKHLDARLRGSTPHWLGSSTATKEQASAKPNAPVTAVDAQSRAAEKVEDRQARQAGEGVKQ